MAREVVVVAVAPKWVGRQVADRWAEPVVVLLVADLWAAPVVVLSVADRWVVHRATVTQKLIRLHVVVVIRRSADKVSKATSRVISPLVAVAIRRQADRISKATSRVISLPAVEAVYKVARRVTPVLRGTPSRVTLEERDQVLILIIPDAGQVMFADSMVMAAVGQAVEAGVIAAVTDTGAGMYTAVHFLVMTHGGEYTPLHPSL